MTPSSAQGPRFSPLSLVALVGWVVLLIAISIWVGQQSYHWLPVQASTAAPLVDGLFSFETAIGTFVFAGVVSVMVWVVLMHRAEKYDESDAEPIEGNTRHARQHHPRHAWSHGAHPCSQRHRGARRLPR